MSEIHLDAATTVRPAEEVVEAMLPWLRERHALPGGGSERARRAQAAVERAREAVAALLGVAPDSVVFTSCLVESNNAALRGAARLARKAGRDRIAIPAHDSPSLLHPARSLAREGFELELLPAGRDGMLASSTLPAGPLAVVALSWIHAELGAVQPVASLATRAREAGALFVVDASLGAGRVPCRHGALGEPDVLTLDFHRMGGPFGVGVLAIRENLPLPPLLEGGAEEQGFRPGVPDLPAIVGAGRAAELARESVLAREERLRVLGRQLAASILSVPDVRLAGPGLEGRLAGHLSVIVGGVNAEALVLALESRGVLCSTGSACAVESGLPAAALRACGYGREEANAMVILCISPTGAETPADLERAAAAFREETERLRLLACGVAGPES